MKKLTFILILFVLTNIVKSQDTTFPMNINVGASANDGTGDKVRTAFQKVNANFSDIYGSVISGPVNGTKYTALRKAVKRITIDPQIASYYYYISKLQNGTAESGHYRYKLEISAASTSPYTSGTVLGSVSFLSDSLYTIEHRIGLSWAISPGGISGNAIIDFSELTAGATYTCSNFVQGGIFATVTGLGSAGGGGGGGGGGLYEDENTTYDYLARPADKDTLNGSSSIYFVENTATRTFYIDSIQKILQSFTVMMSDSVGDGTLYTTTIKPINTTINDKDSVIIYSGQWVTIYPDSLEFQSIQGLTGSSVIADSSLWEQNGTVINPKTAGILWIPSDGGGAKGLISFDSSENYIGGWITGYNNPTIASRTQENYLDITSKPSWPADNYMRFSYSQNTSSIKTYTELNSFYNTQITSTTINTPSGGGYNQENYINLAITQSGTPVKYDSGAPASNPNAKNVILNIDSTGVTTNLIYSGTSKNVLFKVDSTGANLTGGVFMIPEILINSSDTTVTPELGKIIYKSSDNHFYGCKNTGAGKKWYQLDN